LFWGEQKTTVISERAGAGSLEVGSEINRLQ
jgi:hypothetical protein